MDVLVDRRTGVVSRLTANPVPPRLPRAFRMHTAVLSDTTRFGPWASDSAGAGYAFHDDEAAKAAAIGEAVERYCGNLIPPGLVRASYRDLVAAGHDAVDPQTFALFSAEQYGKPGFPCVPMTTDLELEWASGTDLGTGKPTLVPASLVWVSYDRPPRTNPILQAGLAAGPHLGWAQRGALYELAERDTMALAWHGRRSLRFVEPPPTLAALGRHGSLRTRFVEFPNDFGLVVAGALVHDESTGYLTLGTAARSAAEPALRKALAEAFQLQLFVADYDNPHGPYMRAAEHPASPLKPWRADRSYLDAYREDFADVVDYGCHLQLYLDPRAQDRFEAELVSSITGTVAWTDLPAEPEPSVVELAGALGRRVVSVDVTTPDIRPTGLRVVRVLSTGLYSNSAAGLPFLGGTRLPTGGRRALPLPH